MRGGIVLKKGKISDKVNANKRERYSTLVEILIIADDGTGMLDTGAQFASFGIQTEALMELPSAESLLRSDARVAAVNTNTRHADPNQAYRTVKSVVETALRAGVKLVFKKTDSAMRGNIGAELSAVADAVGDEQIYFFPAYPQMGRTTKKGVQYIDGCPVSQSVFGTDPLNPVKESCIPVMLQRYSPISVRTVENPGEWKPDGGKEKILVFDGESQDSFHGAVNRIFDRYAPRVVAGCAGLSTELAKRLSGLKSPVSGIKIPRRDKMFVICGSVNPITTTQMAYGEAHGFVRYTVNQEEILKPGSQKILQKVRQACEEGRSVILDTACENDQKLKTAGWKSEQISRQIVKRINEIAVNCMGFLEDYVLFVTGGDTLESFICESGCERLSILGEISKGIALNAFYIDKKIRYVISKSGGFGNKEILIECLHGNQACKGGGFT